MCNIVLVNKVHDAAHNYALARKKGIDEDYYRQIVMNVKPIKALSGNTTDCIDRNDIM
jgi:hypothetical protein